MFDTHCHLDTFARSLAPIPSHKLLAVASSPDNWQVTLDIASLHHNVLPALGIHPWFVAQPSLQNLHHLESLLNTVSVKALGEIGLDFQRQYSSTKSLQLEVFSKQLALAVKYQLPVSIHCIKAHNEMISLLKKTTVVGVIHGLGSSIEIAKQYIDLGFKFGVNAVAVRDNAVRYHRLIQTYGLNNIVLETDYPNIPLPGHDEAHLSDINEVAEQVAILLNCSISDVIEQTDYNAQQIFQC